MLNTPGKRGRRPGVTVDPKAVRAARAEARLSLAGVAGGKISRTSIHLIETGKMKPSLQTLQLIAARTNKPVSFFIPEPEAPSDMGQLIELEKAAARNESDRVIEIGAKIIADGTADGTDALVRYYVGRAHVLRGDGPAALDHLQPARAAFERLRDEVNLTQCLDQMACAYFLVDDPRALTMAEEALQRCRAMGTTLPELESRILGNLAHMHVHARRFDQAVHFYEECLRAGASVRNLRHRALTYDGLSLAYERLGRLSEATTYANKAIALYSLESDIAAMALAENNLADILMKSGHLSDAERHAQNALRLCDAHQIRTRARSYGLLTMGEIRFLRREPGAKELLNQAIAAAEEQHERVPIACAHQVLGRIAASEKRRDEAIQEFDAAVAMLEELKMPERLLDCLLEYAACLEGAGGSASELWRRAAYLGAELGRPQTHYFDRRLVEVETSAG